MQLVRAWLGGKSGLAALAVFAVIMLWPAVPLGGLSEWSETLTGLFPTNILYPVMAFLAASYTALYFYSREMDSCAVQPEHGAGTTAFGIFLGACPACIPAMAFFLPLSLTIALSHLSWVFLAAATMLLAYLVRKAGGFKS